MHWHGFGRSLVFAAVAATATAAWLLVGAPVLGGRRALALWLVGLLVAYLAGLVPARRRALPVATLAGLAGLGLLALAPSMSALVLGLAALLGVARSVFLCPRRPARAVAAELLLLGGGLVFARALGGPSLHGVLLAVWGFLLVQSCFFLVAGERVRPPRGTERDPFAGAHARLVALLERDPA